MAKIDPRIGLFQPLSSILGVLTRLVEDSMVLEKEIDHEEYCEELVDCKHLIEKAIRDFEIFLGK
jgi:hypothetical protein